MIPQVGERVELLSMPDDPDPIPAGTRGTVERTSELRAFGSWQVSVKWDDGRSLMLSIPPDRVLVVHHDDVREQVARVIAQARADGWEPDPYAVAETVCDEGCARGEYDGCSPELELAYSEALRAAARSLGPSWQHLAA